jgi:putative transcriptional regulator
MNTLGIVYSLCYTVVCEKEVFEMPMDYSRLFEILKAQGWNTTRIRKENLIGQATLQKLKTGEGNIDTRTLERLCRTLNCQPGDIMEYIPKEAQP